MKSLIIPVYKNQDTIPDLFQALEQLNRDLDGSLEVIFVVDGSPDQSAELIQEQMPGANFASKLLVLSRNFGSYPAIRVGLRVATGLHFAVMSADLQEPPALMVEFFRSLESDPIDVVVGIREGREDPHVSRILSDLFWRLYRRLILPEMPVGGVDVFGCNQAFRNQLLVMKETRSSLVAQIFWLGFRRKEIGYRRAARRHGKSAWTFRKRFEYMMDSVFAFTDFPIKWLIYLGGFGFILSILLGMVTFFARITGWIVLPGYATTLLIVLFFGALNMFGLGVVGSYAWRAYENTKHRPEGILMERFDYPASEKQESAGANATILPGTTIGQQAMIEPGAVVTQSVPPYAIAADNPARIIGYVDAGGLDALETMVAQPAENDQEPSEIGVKGVTLHTLPYIKDIRGDLLVGEFERQVPFRPKRYFIVHQVPNEKTRGQHAHRKCEQFLVCIRGRCSVVVDDGTNRRELLLDQPSLGLYLPPMTWGIQYKFSPDAMLLVLASDYYDPEDYIRKYEDFLGELS